MFDGEQGPGQRDSAVQLQSFWPVTGLAEVGAVAVILALNISRGSGMSAWQGVV